MVQVYSAIIFSTVSALVADSSAHPAGLPALPCPVGMAFC